MVAFSLGKTMNAAFTLSAECELIFILAINLKFIPVHNFFFFYIKKFSIVIYIYILSFAQVSFCLLVHLDIGKVFFY